MLLLFPPLQEEAPILRLLPSPLDHLRNSGPPPSERAVKAPTNGGLAGGVRLETFCVIRSHEDTE